MYGCVCMNKDFSSEVSNISCRTAFVFTSPISLEKEPVLTSKIRAEVVVKALFMILHMGVVLLLFALINHLLLQTEMEPFAFSFLFLPLMLFIYTCHR